MRAIASDSDLVLVGTTARRRARCTHGASYTPIVAAVWAVWVHAKAKRGAVHVGRVGFLARTAIPEIPGLLSSSSRTARGLGARGDGRRASDCEGYNRSPSSGEAYLPDPQHEDFRGDEKPGDPPKWRREGAKRPPETEEEVAEESAARDVQRAFEQGITKFPPG